MQSEIFRFSINVFNCSCLSLNKYHLFVKFEILLFLMFNKHIFVFVLRILL